MTCPETIDHLLHQVRAFGGELIPSGPGQLKIRAPSPLPDDLLAELRAHKPKILAALAAPPPRMPYTFRLRDSEGGGVYLSDASTLDAARAELRQFYGDRLLLVASAGGSHD